MPSEGLGDELDLTTKLVFRKVPTPATWRLLGPGCFCLFFFFSKRGWAFLFLIKRWRWVLHRKMGMERDTWGWE